MVKAGESHKPGVWKQENKSHKHGKHKSKGAIDAANRGKTTVKQITTKKRQILSKNQRKNQLVQQRAKKREEAINLKRSLGKTGCPPFLVAIVALNPDEDIASIVELLKSCDDTATISHSQNGTLHICIPRFKQRFSFVIPQQGHLISILDVAKVADTLMLIHSPDSDYTNDAILTALFAQGLPTTVHVTNLSNSYRGPKQNEILHAMKHNLENRFPKEKLINLSTSQEAILLFRQIGSQKRRQIAFRDHRFHMLAEEISFEPHAEKESEGILKVTGYVRGRCVDVNGLVHIPGYGTFQLKQIEESREPNVLSTGRIHRAESVQNLEEMEESQVKILAIAVPGLQQSLESEIVPDAMEGEQTWPTDEELAEAEAAEKVKKRKLPEGMSDYQGSWIVDSENEEDSESESENEISMDDSFKTANSSSDESEDEGTSINMFDTESHQSEVTEDYDNKYDVDMEARELQKFQDAKTDAMFPDEVDTPVDKPAKIRFQKYRGLQSFRTSAWDVKENLPSDYARIYQFENFERTRKKILKNKLDEGIAVGKYVTLHIADVPKHIFDSLETCQPTVVYGLLNHEQKMSVLNMLLRRSTRSDEDEVEPIKSKERLIFQVGCRRFGSCPIFSQHTNGDKHKYERYFRDDKAIVATIFAPVTFSPCSVLVFQETANGRLDLVATGSVMSVNCNRVIVKRIVLSGSPFKINRKSAVVRYMFFTRDDINWFKKIELKTKCGKRGHIREPLGTHGHMKCVFNGHLQSQDTVLMNLYKRVYPKWTFDPFISDLH